MALHDILDSLGERVQDASEETFLLFSQELPSQNLGMIDPHVSNLEITIGKRDFAIKQSPGILQSSRAGGTTGAAVWRLTPLLAEWLASANNGLFKEAILESTSTILELGAGVAGIIPVMLEQKIARYLATDQSYALKTLQDNIESNIASMKAPRPRKALGSRYTQRTRDVSLHSLDWETDDSQALLRSNNAAGGVDLVIASDCIYNYSLIQPLTQTCVDICMMRRGSDKPTVCLIAQQLRQPDVFEEWQTAFLKHFMVWRLSDSTLGPPLGSNSGYAVHVGVLRS